MREKGGKERKNKKEKEKDEVCMRERESCNYVKFYQVGPTFFKIFIKVSLSNVI